MIWAVFDGSPSWQGRCQQIAGASVTAERGEPTLTTDQEWVIGVFERTGETRTEQVVRHRRGGDVVETVTAHVHRLKRYRHVERSDPRKRPSTPVGETIALF